MHIICTTLGIWCHPVVFCVHSQVHFEEKLFIYVCTLLLSWNLPNNYLAFSDCDLSQKNVLYFSCRNMSYSTLTKKFSMVLASSRRSTNARKVQICGISSTTVTTESFLVIQSLSKSMVPHKKIFENHRVSWKNTYQEVSFDFLVFSYISEQVVLYLYTLFK